LTYLRGLEKSGLIGGIGYAYLGTMKKLNLQFISKLILQLFASLLIVSGIGNTLLMYIQDGGISSEFGFTVGIFSLLIGSGIWWLILKYEKAGKKLKQ
jgi:hypothetical protein